MESDIELLKTQVNLIRLSKIIKNPLLLKQKTGINTYNIHYILQDQEKILEDWKALLKTSASSTHSDDCNGIDIIILEWIRRCKMYEIKLTPPVIRAQLLNITEALNISPSYYIKANIWFKIDKILHETNIKPMNRTEIRKTYTPLDLLRSDGYRLLKAQTYEKFFNSLNSLDGKRNKMQEIYGIKSSSKSKGHTVKKSKIKTNSSNLNATKKRNMLDENCKLSYLKKKSNASSTSVDLSSLIPINFTCENENLKETTIKEEPMEYTRDEEMPAALRPPFVKSNVDHYKDGDKNEMNKVFVNIYEDNVTSRNTADECLSTLCGEIKQELVEDEEACSKEEEEEEEREKYGQNEGKVVCDRPKIIYEEIKQEPELIISEDTDILEMTDDESNHRNFNMSNLICQYGSKQKLQDIDTSNRINKFEPNHSSYKEIEIGENAEDDDDDNANDIQIAFESNELMGIIDKYTNENSDQENFLIAKTDVKQKQQLLEENECNEEVLTVLEILPDDDEADNNSIQDTLLKEDFVKNSENPTKQMNSLFKNLIKRTRNESRNNLPSTSKLSISDFPQHTKKPCLNFKKLSIKNNVEAFKYLHGIKNYFKAQNDQEACKLVTKLIMTFMIPNDTIVTKSS